MAGPPNDMQPSELWQALQVQPRPHIIVDFPRVDASGKPVGQVAIWVLSHSDQTSASAAAEATTRRLLKTNLPRADEAHQGYDDIYGNEAAIEVLSRALRNPKNLNMPAFPNVDALRTLSVDEIGVLMGHYHEAQTKLGPIIGHLSDEEYEAWVDRLASGGASVPLAPLSSQARIYLITRMATELRTFQIGSSSAGSALDATEAVSPTQ